MVKCSICGAEGVNKASFINHPEKHDIGKHDPDIDKILIKLEKVKISNEMDDDVFPDEEVNESVEIQEELDIKKLKKRAEYDISKVLAEYGISKIPEFSKDCSFKCIWIKGGIKPEFSSETFGKLVIVIEVDELQHKYYNTRKELARAYVYCLKRDRLPLKKTLVIIRLATNSRAFASEEEIKLLRMQLDEFKVNPPKNDCIYYLNYSKDNKHVKSTKTFLKRIGSMAMDFQHQRFIGILKPELVLTARKFELY